MNLEFKVVCICIFYMCFKVHISTGLSYRTIRSKIVKSSIYVPAVIDKTCYLKPDKGPCRGNIETYYYNPSSKKCATFLWGGCQGNGNRFDTNEECLTSCLSQPNPPLKTPKWCSLTFDYGFCFGDVKVWYYDPLWQVCKERIYSGCGGNKNNFYNREQCQKICIYGYDMYATTSESKSNIIKKLIINPEGAIKTRRVSTKQATATVTVTNTPATTPSASSIVE